MLEVGVAVRLNKLPAEVRGHALEDLALVAAYCALEAEQMRSAPAAPPAGGGTTRTTTYTVKRK